MTSNILITGAAGYIGGSIVADFLANNLFSKEQISVTVRSEEQAQAVSKLGVNVLRLDLTDEVAVSETVLRHGINIVIQTVSSIDPGLSLPLINALGKYKETTGQQTYFIHTSGLSAFCERNGWPSGTWKDSDPVFDEEKELQDSFPLRKTDVTITEHSKGRGVTSFIVVPSTVYGKGTGEWNKLSVVVPPIVKGSISKGKVYKFAEDTKRSCVHISDMTALYGHLVEKILRNESIPSGNEGYYFALGHSVQWSKMLNRLAEALKARDLITDSTTQVWPSDDFAAETLGAPVQFVPVLWNSGDDLVTENTYKIGWKPQWDTERFLNDIDDEIDAVQQEGKAKSSLMDSLHAAAAARG